MSTPHITEKTETTAQSEWWNSNTTGGAGCATLIFIGVIVMLYQVDWSGLKGKNVWDWFELIIVPFVLAVGGLYLQRMESDRIKRQEDIEKERADRQEAIEKERIKQQETIEKERIAAQAEREKQQAKDNLMDGVFQSYLDDMSDLMIINHLQTMLDIVTAERLSQEAEANDDTETDTEADVVEPYVPVDKAKLAEATAIVTVARARTVTAFRTLDAARRNLLTNFLRETGLVAGEKGTLLVGIQLGGIDLSQAHLVDMNLAQVNLESANLQYANLRDTNLQNAMLSSANLQNAIAHSANLQDTELSHANLHDADLSFANLQNAFLNSANLQNANLTNANLQNTVLTDANLQDAFLSDTNLQSAFLPDANLQDAYLVGARLQGTMLARTNLKNANIENTQYDDRTVLPDSGIHRHPYEDYLYYDKHWSEDIDMSRYVNPDHPDFWEPHYLKADFDGVKPVWMREEQTASNE